MKPKSGFVMFMVTAYKGKFSGVGKPVDVGETPKGHKFIIYCDAIQMIFIGIPLALIFY